MILRIDRLQIEMPPPSDPDPIRASAVSGGAGALVQYSNAKAWNGDYVFASGNLIEDLTHNFSFETGARNNKLKVTRWWIIPPPVR